MAPTFRYSTLPAVKDRVTAELITDASITDAEILKEIETASALINKWTRQIFQVSPEAVRVSGQGDRVITHPSLYPFILLKEISVNTTRTTGEFKEMDRIIPGMRNFPEGGFNRTFRSTNVGGLQIIDLDGTEVEWERGIRTINMISLLRGFPKGPRNIEMIGWWACLENHKTVETTLSTLNIPANSTGITTVMVTDIIDATTGDFIEIGDTIAITVQEAVGALIPTRVELAIVQSIAGAGPYTLTFDPLHSYPVEIPVGAAIRSFGRTPEALSEVAEYLAGQLVMQKAAERTGDTVTAAALSGNLVSEKTDNYSYKLRDSGSPSSGDGGKNLLGKFTGNARMDLVLRQFVQSAAVVKVV